MSERHVYIETRSYLKADPARVQDIFTTAMEGGVNYWAEVLDSSWDASSPLDFTGLLLDLESEGDTFDVDLDVMMTGLTFYGERFGVEKLVDILSEDWDFDAGDADTVVQLGIFGAVVFG